MKKNLLYDKRVKALYSILTEKLLYPKNKVPKSIANKTLEDIKENILLNSIINQEDLENKILSIQKSLKSMLYIENNQGSFFKYKKENKKKIKRLEGHPISEGIFINVLFKSDDIMISEIIRKKLSKEPMHQNHDHKTFSVLTSGKLKLIIDENEFIADPGDAWIYKEEELHSVETILDSTEISIKFPPIKTW